MVNVNVPMAGTARESVRNSRITSDTTYDIPEAADTKQGGSCERYLGKVDGVNLKTGRSKSTRYSGAY